MPTCAIGRWGALLGTWLELPTQPPFHFTQLACFEPPLLAASKLWSNILDKQNLTATLDTYDLWNIWSEWWKDKYLTNKKTMAKTKTVTIPFRKHTQRGPLWPLCHFIIVMKRHDLTSKKTLTKTNTMTKTNPLRKHPQRKRQTQTQSSKKHQENAFVGHSKDYHLGEQLWI